MRILPRALSEVGPILGASGASGVVLASCSGVNAGMVTVRVSDVAVSPCRLVTVTLTFTVVLGVTETWRYVEPPATVTGSV